MYKIIWLKTLQVMSNVKFSATQTGWYAMCTDSNRNRQSETILLICILLSWVKNSFIHCHLNAIWWLKTLQIMCFVCVLFLCLCIYVYTIICTYRYVHVNTRVCMYVDYARAYTPKHTCRCKGMGKLVIWAWAILFICIYKYICTCAGVCIYA